MDIASGQQAVWATLLLELFLLLSVTIKGIIASIYALLMLHTIYSIIFAEITLFLAAVQIIA
jgi:hypothetical protein